MVNPERGGPVTVRILGPQFISLDGCLVISTIFNEYVLNIIDEFIFIVKKGVTCS